jgi:hypothetical protein
MGFLIKSAIGLGCVYFAMFGQTLKSADLAPTTNLCASVAKAAVAGGAALRAQWAAAGCVAALETRTQALAAPAAPPPALRTTPRSAAGTLSDADLREPWFGPGRIPRKVERRG